MNILILEDEEHSAIILKNHLWKWDQNLNIPEALPSIESCRNWLNLHGTPELIFSDIELLDGNIFSFLAQSALQCPVIFTTAYDMFMQPAFQYNGIGYLLKPISYEKIEAAMQKYAHLKTSFKQHTPHIWETLQKTFTSLQRNYKQRFVVRAKNGLILLPTESIAFFQSDEGVVSASDLHGKKYFLNETLQSLEELLDPTLFFRINRSSIVNINFIEKIEPYFDDRLSVKIKKQDTYLVSSISRTPLFRKWLE